MLFRCDNNILWVNNNLSALRCTLKTSRLCRTHSPMRREDGGRGEPRKQRLPGAAGPMRLGRPEVWGFLVLPLLTSCLPTFPEAKAGGRLPLLPGVTQSSSPTRSLPAFL